MINMQDVFPYAQYFLYINPHNISAKFINKGDTQQTRAPDIYTCVLLSIQTVCGFYKKLRLEEKLLPSVTVARALRNMADTCDWKNAFGFTEYDGKCSFFGGDKALPPGTLLQAFMHFSRFNTRAKSQS